MPLTKAEIDEQLRIHELHENLKKAESLNMQNLSVKKEYTRRCSRVCDRSLRGDGVAFRVVRTVGCEWWSDSLAVCYTIVRRGYGTRED